MRRHTMAEPSAVDILVDTANPAALDATVQALPGCIAVVLGGPDDYVRHEDAWVVRCLAGADALKFMIEHQGYGKVIRQLDELL
jgi:hypothetical protein